MRMDAANSGLIDWRLPVPGGLTFRLLERPGVGLPADELDGLVADLRSVADRCVGEGRLRYGVLSGDPERLADAVFAAVYRRDTGAMVGFNAMVVLDVALEAGPARLVHAGLCLVDADLRSRGLCVALTAAPALLCFLRGRCAPLWFTNVTQVPAAAGIFSMALDDVFPAPGRLEPPSPVHRRIVSEVVAQHRSAFGVGDDAVLDEAAFVVRNAYTGGSDWLKKSFAECAKHRDARFNAWCAELLDYARGDDLIQVGRMSVRQWLQLALRLVRGLGPGRSARVRATRPRSRMTADARGCA